MLNLQRGIFFKASGGAGRGMPGGGDKTGSKAITHQALQIVKTRAGINNLKSKVNTLNRVGEIADRKKLQQKIKRLEKALN